MTLATPVADAVHGVGLQLEPLTVEQYAGLVDAGLLPEGAAVELLDGVLVRTDRRDAGGDIMTEGVVHLTVRQDLYDLLTPLVRPHGFHCNTNAPVALPPRNAPEPDVVVLPGRRRLDRRESRGGALPPLSSAAAVFEVSWSSLSTDRAAKLDLYAAAGVPTYVILNLRDGVALVRTDPDPAVGEYRGRAELTADETLPLRLSAGAAIDVPLRESLG